MTPLQITLILDTREPHPHPWLKFWPADLQIERGTLETGDVALAGNPAVCIERKTAPDFLACIGGQRERFERELKRARYCDAFAVIVESDFAALLSSPGGLHPASIIGTVAAWNRRYCPVIFASSPRFAADLALRFLSGPIKDARRLMESAVK